MNKKEVVYYISSFVILFCLLFSMVPTVEASKYQNDSSSVNVSVNIKQPFVKIQISPNEVSLGETTVGYNTNSSNITFVNKGTLDVTITPILNVGANPIFNYLEFGTASCSSWHNMTYYGSNTLLGILSKSSIYNGVGEEDSACIRLGLDSYNGPELDSDLNLSTDVIFWAMPA